MLRASYFLTSKPGMKYTESLGIIGHIFIYVVKTEGSWQGLEMPPCFLTSWSWPVRELKNHS